MMIYYSCTEAMRHHVSVPPKSCRPHWETSLAHGLRHIHLLIKKQPKAFQFAPDELSYSRMKPDTGPLKNSVEIVLIHMNDRKYNFKLAPSA
jgi:hypothetical protein